MALRLLVDVDVQRPVGETKRLRQRMARRGAGRLGRAPAAGGEQAGKRQHRAARGGAFEKLAAGEDIGHSDPSSESTTNVESGLQLRVRCWPGAAPLSPG